jgi:FKBP12-rapamycin complex-associated protein
MEEIIDLKTFENKVEKASLEFNGEYQYMKMVEELNSRKQRLQDIWSDRLHGAPKEVEVWYKILSTRQLY